MRATHFGAGLKLHEIGNSSAVFNRCQFVYCSFLGPESSPPPCPCHSSRSWVLPRTSALAPWSSSNLEARFQLSFPPSSHLRFFRSNPLSATLTSSASAPCSSVHASPPTAALVKLSPLRSSPSRSFASSRFGGLVGDCRRVFSDMTDEATAWAERQDRWTQPPRSTSLQLSRFASPHPITLHSFPPSFTNRSLTL